MVPAHRKKQKKENTVHKHIKQASNETVEHFAEVSSEGLLIPRQTAMELGKFYKISVKCFNTHTNL